MKSLKKTWNAIRGGIKRLPVISFIMFIGILVALIALGNYLRKPDTTERAESKQPIDVAIYSIGSAPKMGTQASVEKSGTIKVVAQKGGVVQQVHVQEGDQVYKGNTLAWLSTNYQGGTIETLQRQKAQKSYEDHEGNFDARKRDIDLQRDRARAVESDAYEQREITEDSLNKTRNEIDLANEIIDNIESNIEELEQLPQTNDIEAQITQLKTTKFQMVSSRNQLEKQLELNEYTTGAVAVTNDAGEKKYGDDGDDNPAARLPLITRDITLQQLDLQEKSIALSKEIAQIDLWTAQVTEALMYPASPTQGKVERVHIDVGDVVNPGDMIATITAEDNAATAVVLVSPDVARSISFIEPAVITYGNNEVLALHPYYVSTEPTNGTLHSVFFAIPDDVANEFTDGSLVDVDLPVGNIDTGSTVPFIPIDAVYQTQARAFVYVAQEGGHRDESNYIAKVKEVELGQVYGSYVEIVSGLDDSDQVIVDRTVVENDPVTFEKTALPSTGL